MLGHGKVVVVITSLFRYIGEIMALFINSIYKIIPSYGIAIILLTLLMRLLFFPLSIKQVRNGEKMKQIQPKLRELQEKYKNNKEELARRQMDLYRENNVSLTGGCLPLLLQWPFLIAMYQMLSKPVEFGLEKFPGAMFLGIELAKGGTYKPLTAIFTVSLGHLILALLSGASTYYQTKLMSPAPAPGSKDPNAAPDPASSMQRSMLMIMPIMMAWFTFVWQAGIGIYWVATNVFTIIQQLVIIKYFMHDDGTKGNAKVKPKTGSPKGR